MITDLVQIKRLGEQKRVENERFRRHMKTHPVADRRLRLVGEAIQAEIDCQTCANCCRVATATLLERDVAQLSRFLGLKPARFLADYTEVSAEEGLILKRDSTGACVFLSGNDCTAYEARPATCEGFPHIVRGAGSLAKRMWQFIDRACYCPIVYNAIEAWKVETGFTPGHR